MTESLQRRERSRPEEKNVCSFKLSYSVPPSNTCVQFDCFENVFSYERISQSGGRGSDCSNDGLLQTMIETIDWMDWIVLMFAVVVVVVEEGRNEWKPWMNVLVVVPHRCCSIDGVHSNGFFQGTKLTPLQTLHTNFELGLVSQRSRWQPIDYFLYLVIGKRQRQRIEYEPSINLCFPYLAMCVNSCILGYLPIYLYTVLCSFTILSSARIGER